MEMEKYLKQLELVVSDTNSDMALASFREDVKRVVGDARLSDDLKLPALAAAAVWRRDEAKRGHVAGFNLSDRSVFDLFYSLIATLNHVFAEARRSAKGNAKQQMIAFHKDFLDRGCMTTLGELFCGRGRQEVLDMAQNFIKACVDDDVPDDYNGGDISAFTFYVMTLVRDFGEREFPSEPWDVRPSSLMLVGLAIGCSDDQTDDAAFRENVVKLARLVKEEYPNAGRDILFDEFYQFLDDPDAERPVPAETLN